jgi:mRNA interferase MazF
MIKYKAGTVILIKFPFIDNPKKSKIRPSLVISKSTKTDKNIIVCFITSREKNKKNIVKIENTPLTGLKVPSILRLDKIVTVADKIVIGEIGKVESQFFKEYGKNFFNIFKFEK